MTDVHKIARFSISTGSIDPPRGIFEINTASSTMKFELDQDLAHSLCTSFERFLTQPSQRKRSRQRCG